MTTQSGTDARRRQAGEAGWLRRVTALAAGLVQHWRNRRNVAALLAFDDVMLRDIGITRLDVHAALAEPMFRDVSLTLAERAMTARRGERLQRRDALEWAHAKGADRLAAPEPVRTTTAPRAA